MGVRRAGEGRCCAVAVGCDGPPKGIPARTRFEPARGGVGK